MQAIIEGNLYEIEPAVKVILDRVMTENAELKRENKRLEEAFQKATGVIAATDCVECKRGTQAKAEYDAMIAEWERDGVDLSKTGVRQKDGGESNE